MGIPSGHRWVAVGVLNIRSHKRSVFGPDFNLNDLIAVMQERAKKEDTKHTYAKDRRVMWCRSDEICNDNKNFYRFILHVGDKNVAEAAYLDFDTLKTRSVGKKDSEGAHYSSHIIIARKENGSKGYLILIEKMPGVYLASVKNYLTWILRDFRKETEGLGGKTKEFQPVVDLVGCKSKTIGDALETGVLQDVKFVEYNEIDRGIDEKPLLEQVMREIRIDVRRKLRGNGAREFFKWFKESIIPSKIAGKIYVRIKANNGQIRQTEVDLDNEEILEQAFVLNEVVTDFASELPQFYDGFRDEMLSKMEGVAQKVRVA